MEASSHSSQEYVVTLVSPQGISGSLVDKLARKLASKRIVWLSENEAVDLFCHWDAALPGRVGEALKDSPVDVFMQEVATRRKRLLIADMESTIIRQEMLDELADMIGIREVVSRITHRAMNGELDFGGALRERVALLRGISASVLDGAAARIDLMSGAATLIATMRTHGATCWLASGGFDCFAEVVMERLGFDAFYSNRLGMRDGHLTGEVLEPIFDKEGKRRLLDKGCRELGLSIADIVAVGDGSNDIAMLTGCCEGKGLGVAFRAKPIVREVVQTQINCSDLTAILYAQGYSRSAFVSA